MSRRRGSAGCKTGWLLSSAVAVGLLGACSGTGPPAAEPETVWRGEVVIREDRVFPRGSTLVLEPGTVVRFAFRDDDGDGWGDASLRVEGNLVARGTPDAPVVFTTADRPAQAGRWGELRIDFGSFQLAHTVIEGSTRGIHSHFSRGTVTDSVFRHNIDGTRLGESTVRIEHCLFYAHSGKAYNARLCRNQLVGNRFHHNRNAIFLFEADSGSRFTDNQFRGNDHAFRLGDFFQGTVTTSGNDWGGAVPSVPATGPDETPAGVVTQPGPVPFAGARNWPAWEEAWAAEIGGFVDAPVRPADEGVYVTSWSGALARIGSLDGAVLAASRLPDAVDSGVALAGGLAAVQCWDRAVYLLDRQTLEPRDRFLEMASPADDHRQAAPVFLGDTLFVGTWAGALRAFDTRGGRLRERWSFRAGGAFRAAPVMTAVGLLAPSQDGNLYCLGLNDGTLRWHYRARGPLLSSPVQDGRRAYVADRSGTLHAVRLADGTPAWTVPLEGPAWYASPLLLDGLLYQGCDTGTFRAVAADTGVLRWQVQLDSAIRARPAPAGATAIAVPTTGGHLYLLDRTTGLERDVWPLPQGSQSDPGTLGARVFVGARDGTVRALDVREKTGTL